ncbi:hypothetical protein HN604_01180 [archaeon]|jgi:hypothetical protein|nr:hypothetical protein [archaeon]MBT6182919.1 hypothetical protein [archaeon]MBT6606770.1 hypothetical protein [archaeon]MBT7251757.1 hypothetical protein [archaeon]MBT7660676.1 hypothetical protein [archaeon]
MGWFSKEEKVPTLSRSPEGLAMPKKDPSMANDLPELPSFPNSPHNDSFNQEMVKSAVTDTNLPGENEVHFDIPEGVNITEEHGGSLLPPLPQRKPEETQEEAPVHESLKPKNLLPTKPITPVKTMPKDLPMSSISPSPEKKVAEKIFPAQKQPGEPIFVRFDKFSSSQKNFKKIKDKVSDIEKTLQKIADVKQKEDDELNKWAGEVDGLKMKLSQIDSEIFDQI